MASYTTRSDDHLVDGLGPTPTRDGLADLFAQALTSFDRQGTARPQYEPCAEEGSNEFRPLTDAEAEELDTALRSGLPAHHRFMNQAAIGSRS
jgi:hypothetical protein